MSDVFVVHRSLCVPGDGGQAKRIVRQKELCCLFLQTDHRLGQALFRDMSEMGLIDGPARTTEEKDWNSPFVPFSAVEVGATPSEDDKPEDEALGGGVAGKGDEEQPAASERLGGDVCGRPPGHAISSRTLSLQALPEYQRLLDVATWWVFDTAGNAGCRTGFVVAGTREESWGNVAVWEMAIVRVRCCARGSRVEAKWDRSGVREGSLECTRLFCRAVCDGRLL